MHSEPPIPDLPDDDSLPPEWLEALHALPSEQGGPSLETDAAIMASARETLAAIRRHKLRQHFWPILATAACVLLAITLFTKPGHTPNSGAAAPVEDKYALILREVTAVFPHQVQAIIADGGELRISLADHAISGKKQAVVVELCEAKQCTTVITYVGQTVVVGEHRITVHADEKGAIVVDTTEVNPSGAASDLTIKSRPI